MVQLQPQAVFAGANLRKIAVVYANNKTTSGAVVHPTANTRHWKSYHAVAEDIRDTLVGLGLVDTVVMPDGVDLVQRLQQEKVELVWLNTGGVQGESPMCQTPALLETAGIPYIGHSPLNAALLDDKGLFKLACRGLGIKTAPFIVHNGAYGLLDVESSSFRSAFGDYRGPFIVKPVNGRASQNVMYVEALHQVPDMVAQVAAASNCLVMVERFLAGKEYCIAVMGAGSAGAVAFSAVERQLEEDEKVFTSMDVRAITNDRVRVMNPFTESTVVNELAALGTAVYNSLSLTSLVRLDIRADESGELYVLEANPKPDLKKPSGASTSLVASGLQYLGWGYQDLIACLLVERLLQLQLHKPYMLAHFMPESLTAQDLAGLLPECVQAVLGQQLPVVPLGRQASGHGLAAAAKRSSAAGDQQQQQQASGQDAGAGDDQAVQQVQEWPEKEQEHRDMDWMAFAIEEEDGSQESCAAPMQELSGRSMLLPLQQQVVAGVPVERKTSSFVMERPCSLLVPCRRRLATTLH